MDSLDKQFGKYTLVDKIGDGGMAEVYRARVAGVGGFEKIVALKKIHPSLSSNERFQKNFVNEARICGQLHHHNVVEVYEFDRVGDAFYLAMEFIDGPNLEDILDVQRTRRKTPLPTKVIVSLMVQVLEGLNYAHNAHSLDGKALNVIHRDLKPSNILIDRSGVVKIVDFGVAKADMNRYVTQEMTAKGTASYMAPEQVLGEKKLTHLVDIFAVGGILYELITSKRLFDGDHVFAILKSVATSRAEDIVAGLPPHGQLFGPILKKLLARDPSERVQDSAEVLRDFTSLGISDIGPRTLERFLRDLEDEIEESQTTIIDSSGLSAVTAAADPERDPLYQTSPTRVAFMPTPSASRTSLAAGAKNSGGFDIPPEDEIDDDSPTRMTANPTRVSANLVTMQPREVTETTATGASAAPERTETGKVDLSTERIPTRHQEPAVEPSSTYHSSERPSPPPTEATVPGTPTYLTPQAPRRREPVEKTGSSLTLSLPNTDEDNTASTLIKIVILAAAVVVMALAFFFSAPKEHQVNVDFRSNLDPATGLLAPQSGDTVHTGVDILQGGELLCRTPCTQPFTFTGDRAGLEVEARREGYHPESQHVPLDASLEAAAPRDVRFFMRAVPQRVTVNSEPAGARIFVNGADTGFTTPHEVEVPSVGKHTFRLELDGHDPREHVVEVGLNNEALDLELGEPTNPSKGRRK